MRGVHLLAAIVGAAIFSSMASEEVVTLRNERPKETTLGEAAHTGTPGADCWRIKSLTRVNGPREGQEWKVTKIKFYESEDGTGDALTGTALSSGDQTTGGECTDSCGVGPQGTGAFCDNGWRDNVTESNRDCVAFAKMAGGEQCRFHGFTDFGSGKANDNCCDCGGGDITGESTLQAAANAFADDDTVWQAKRKDAGEYIGLQLDAATTVRSMRVMQTDFENGVKAAVLEKSVAGSDGICSYWARVAEFPDFPKSYGAEESFSWKSLDQDTAPGAGSYSDVFQIRSRADPRYCVGVQKADSEKNLPRGAFQSFFDIDAKLELQLCEVKNKIQYFYLDDKGRLFNIYKSGLYMASNVAGTYVEGGNIKMTTCPTEGCPDPSESSDVTTAGFSITEEGFFRSSNHQNFIMKPETSGASTDATPNLMVVTACTTETDPVKPAELEDCPANTDAQFDLVPMFTIANQKQAVNCAPYSHTYNKEPEDVTSDTNAEAKAKAQVACALDDTCKVYMFGSSDAPEAAHQQKAWLCSALDVVYNGKVGYSLGFRAGNNNEEEAAELDSFDKALTAVSLER
jgi:hypothetical protein